jgi:hypothetical protein
MKLLFLIMMTILAPGIAHSNREIDNAWILVPWSSGGYYYHNTLTREDIDHHPQCLSDTCRWQF